MGKYTIFLMFENPRRSRQARNFTENDPKILDLKSSSEQIIFRKLSLGAPVMWPCMHALKRFLFFFLADWSRMDIMEGWMENRESNFWLCEWKGLLSCPTNFNVQNCFYSVRLTGWFVKKTAKDRIWRFRRPKTKQISYGNKIKLT